MKKKILIFVIIAVVAVLTAGVCLIVGLSGNSGEESAPPQEENSEMDLTGEKSIVSPLNDNIGVYSTIDVNKCYGICNGYKFACKAEITTPSGQVKAVDSTYTATEEGEYTVKLTSLIGGEKVEKTVSVLASGYSAQALFTMSNASFLQDCKPVAENLTTDIRTGVQFLLEANNSTVSFKPVINLNDLADGSLSSIIEFTTNANSEYLPDLRGLRVVLTDVYDSTNKVAVSFTMSESIFYLERPAAIEEGTASVPALKAEWNGYAIGDSSNYTAEPGKTYPFGCSFYPQLHLTASHTLVFDPMTVYFNNAENTVTTAKGQLVYDLDNPADSFADFKGFTTGEVYVSIESTGTSGDIVITKIGNYEFDKIGLDSYKTANDNLLLSGYDFDNALDGIVGYAYPLPKALMGDAVQTKIYKINGDSEDEIAFDGSFVPSQAGEYAIVCSSTNSYGYSAQVKGYFTVLQSPVAITSPSATLTAKLLDVWKVPDLSFGGGIGDISLEYKFKKGDSEILVNPGDAFEIDEKGEEIRLSVIATDAMGYSQTFDFPVEVDCNFMHFELVDTYDTVSVCAGSYVTVPNYVAIDYSKEDVSINNVDITIRQGKTKVLQAGQQIEVKADSVISYYAGSTLVKTFTIRCLEEFIEGKPVANQFKSSQGVNQIFTSKIGTAFRMSGETAKIEMPYVISSTNLFMQFSVFADMTASGEITATLTDVMGKELVYTLKHLGLSPTLWINGKQTYAKVTASKNVYSETDVGEFFGREYYTYSFVVEGAKACLYNGESLKIGDIDMWNNGLIYQGFEKGKVKLCFDVKGVNGAHFVLNRVSNQGFTSIHLGKGERIAPMIAFDSAFGAGSAQKDSIVKVPKAYAYDVFDSKAYVNMSIVAPNGEFLAKDLSANAFEFTANEYGIYRVTYEVKDSKGNKSNTNYLIVVTDDVAPTVKVNGEYEEEYRGSVKVLSATATDNVDGELTVKVWIEKSDMTTREVGMEQTVTLEKGEYVITYYAMDKNGNFAVKRFKIKVK
ncbi:MAG: hypothetical protein IJY84_02530 [Clostridia bacterium]|nr:hypothetical protein [Clostridia bacterium]